MYIYTYLITVGRVMYYNKISENQKPRSLALMNLNGNQKRSFAARKGTLRLVFRSSTPFSRTRTISFDLPSTIK